MQKIAIGKRLRAVIAANRQNWRRWAHDLATGKSEPSAAEIIEAAAHLRFEDPGERLEADAEVIRAVHTAERTIAACQKAREEQLVPWGGDIEKLRAAVEATKAEHTRLAEILASAEWPTEWSARATADRLRRDNPLLFEEQKS